MMNRIDNLSVAHVDHNKFVDSLNFTESSYETDLGWFKHLIQNSPNGNLLKSNVQYEILKNNKVYLAHVTTNLKLIKDNCKLLASSGCLIGSIYCTPVLQHQNKLRLHNLGDYILHTEAPKFKGSRQEVSLLLVELDLSANQPAPTIGIDYLQLGSLHFSVFSELSYLLSPQEQEDLKKTTIGSIRAANSLWSITSEIPIEKIIERSDAFYRLYQSATKKLPILGYLLFEVLCEYIALYQSGEVVQRYKKMGELYCPNFKNIIFSVCPNLTRSFNLGLFSPNLHDIMKYLDSANILQAKDHHNFKEYLIRRLCYLIMSRFYSPSTHNEIEAFWRNIEWDFPYLQKLIAPLLGHTIHRVLRNMCRYPNFFFYFDQYKALHVWNYWNHLNVALPYNAILPKGEVGLNPASPIVKYKIFSTHTYQNGGFTYVEKNKELPILIEPRLSEVNMLLMRKKICNHR